MALNDVALQSAIEDMFNDVRDGKTVSEAAAQLKEIISDYVRSATVNVTVSTTGTAVAQTGTGTGSLS